MLIREFCRAHEVHLDPKERREQNVLDTGATKEKRVNEVLWVQKGNLLMEVGLLMELRPLEIREIKVTKENMGK